MDSTGEFAMECPNCEGQKTFKCIDAETEEKFTQPCNLCKGTGSVDLEFGDEVPSLDAKKPCDYMY